MGSKTTQTNTAPAAAQAGLDQGWRNAQALYNQGGFQVDPYQGDLVAQFDPLRQQSYDMASGVAQGAMGGVDAARGAAMRAMDPTARSAAWGQVKQNVIADIMPGINSSFAGSGRTGSGLHMQNLAKGLSSGLANAEVNAWQQGENRALQAAGMMPGINQAAYGATGYLDQAGAGMQDYNQSVIQANALRDYQSQTSQRDALTDYLSLLSGTSSPFATQEQRQKSGIGGIFGAALQAAPFLAGLSDERAKTDIKKVGKTDEGLGVYTYRYKTGGPIHMGVMAQEVEKKHPDAVREVGGLKAVNYAKL